MKFDKWFNDQSLILKIILLIIPFVGWLCELLIRLSVMLRKKDTLSIVTFVVYVVIGYAWVLEIIDIIWLCLKGRLILTD
jgi:hypothetical protein